MLPVLPPPGAQLRLHGVHVLLDVVHDLAQRQRVAAHRLNGRAEALDLPRHQVPLLVARHLGHHVLQGGGAGGEEKQTVRFLLHLRLKAFKDHEN